MPDVALSGKVALVTGSSRGIGASIACRLAKSGVKIGVNYNTNQDAAEQVVANIVASGGEAFAVAGDVSQEDSAQAVVKQATERWGQIDILVNNAGITRDRLLLRMTLEDWDQVLDVDLRSAFLCTKFVMPQLIKRRQGRVINISSVVGIGGNPGQANYAAAKAGLIGFTKAVAREVASRNVTVNAVAPGFIDTGGMVGQMTEEARQQILSRIPLGRFGSGDEVAEVVAFLCGKGGDYITGQVLTIDGGLIA
ncbi:MAG: 3-oxoacyl-[acyl-carrier-protein] reductase [Chloroflexi bacterium]|nr:3-oxoacyl-[acyl-carrier-protein] reductase [Chloroflexota bacterium]MDA1217894.1 3-oxoacyl-[acyl-carrier-protein] reductase [Chloroflexota bacterium]PKB56962.1 MAG: 3-oxoacyl-[acyl-carrier-protein] reductase [SAR202 cluster bacterium Casp-Chloro-G3]